MDTKPPMGLGGCRKFPTAPMVREQVDADEYERALHFQDQLPGDTGGSNDPFSQPVAGQDRGLDQHVF